MARGIHMTMLPNIDSKFLQRGSLTYIPWYKALVLPWKGGRYHGFKTLKPSVLYNFETLIKQFIEAYSKIGIKHNTVTQILSFKQKDKEIVRECVDRLRHYIVQCPESKMPSQEKLILCFLEGLRDKQLYTHLFTKGHRDFDECYDDAQKN